MKLVSLWKHWATLMALGKKRIETRSWFISYRGWLAIHASKGGLGKRTLQSCIKEHDFAEAPRGETLSPGCIVAVVKLVDCLPMVSTGCLPGVFEDYPELDTRTERAFGDYGDGRWAWVTKGCFRLAQPIPFRGKQGLVTVDDATIRQIREQWIETRRVA